jgi:Cas7 group CRISPR-associated protein Csh2
MPNDAQMINRGTGLLVIEVSNSNPNGDPDRESDPRQLPNEHGEISPVSFKRKTRDLVSDKDGPVWQTIAGQFQPDLVKDNFHILESRGRDRQEIVKELVNGDTFKEKYWDGRIYGHTFLEEGTTNTTKTGVVQFGMGVSIAPISIIRMTNTNKAGVQEGKDRGMAPLAYRIVNHGVYCMPFFVNPSCAHKTGCTRTDIELLLKVIPFAYSHTASYVRPHVEIRHAWYAEHKSSLGSFSDFEFLQAMTPRKIGDSRVPSSSWNEYDVPVAVPEALKERILSFRDLVSEAYLGSVGS